MKITDLNEMEVYQIACKIENDSVRFYSYLAEHANTKENKDILEFLSKQEEAHGKKFRDRLRYLNKLKNDEKKSDDFLENFDFGIFRPFKDVENFKELLSDPKKIYEMAIIIEKRTIKFYELCKGKALSILTDIELESIIDTEKKHLMFFIEKLTS
jgi:rubrerythrin